MRAGRRLRARLLFLLLPVAGIAVPAARPTAAVAQAPAASPEPASPEPARTAPAVRAFLEPTATAVGGKIELVVEVDLPPGWLVEPPARDLDLSPFRVRAAWEIPREGGKGYRLVIVPLEAGDVEVPAVPLTFRGPNGDEVKLATEPLPVAVASNLPPPAAGDGGEAGEPEPAALKPALEAPRNWIPILVAAAALLLAALAAFLLLRKLRGRERKPAEATVPRKPLRPAWELALEDLDRIASAGYVERGEMLRQYVEVTGTLRRYLEDRYGVPALESTTTDLNELLRRSPVGSEISARILSILGEADLVKFAKAQPAPAEARASEGRVRGVVLETIPPPPAPPAAVGSPPSAPTAAGDGGRP